MDDKIDDSESAGPRVEDGELIAVLRRAKKEHGLPALVTSQFNDIGGYDYSGTALNSRLSSLHEEGIIGHIKAGNRHLWWSSGEGETEPVELPTLESLVDYDKIDSTRFSEEQAKNIAAENIPGFEKNWWERMDQEGEELFNFGLISFLGTIVLVLLEISVPEWVIGLFGFISFTFIGTSIALQLIGASGAFLEKHGVAPAEPFGGKNLKEYLWERFVPL